MRFIKDEIYAVDNKEYVTDYIFSLDDNDIDLLADALEWYMKTKENINKDAIVNAIEVLREEGI